MAILAFLLEFSGEFELIETGTLTYIGFGALRSMAMSDCILKSLGKFEPDGAYTEC